MDLFFFSYVPGFFFVLFWFSFFCWFGLGFCVCGLQWFFLFRCFGLGFFCGGFFNEIVLYISLAILFTKGVLKSVN